MINNLDLVKAEEETFIKDRNKTNRISEVQLDH